VSPEVRNEVEFNGHGMVGPERPFDKPAGIRRVLLLGDSYTASLQVPYDSSWARELELALGPGWEVLNAGVSGYGTDNALFYLREVGWRFDPDLVLLTFFTSNDVSDNHYELYRRTGATLTKPHFTLEQSGLTLRAAPVVSSGPNPLNLLREHSHLYLFTARTVKRMMTRQQSRRAGERGVPLNWLVYRRELSPEFEVAWQTTAGLLEMLRDEAHAYGAPIAVSLMPAGWRIEPEDRARLYETYPDMLDETQWDLEQPDRRVRIILDELQIPVHDLTPELTRARGQSHGRLFLDHLTPEGHRVVGKALVPFVLDAVHADANPE
jgi:lysophospholipase L1-like esterase